MRAYQIIAPFKAHNGRIATCDSQSALHGQEIYSPQCFISCAMMRVMFHIAFVATTWLLKS